MVKKNMNNYKQHIEEYQKKLEEGIKSFLSSEKWSEYLKVQARFHKYSFNNIIMIILQKPDATRVAGYNTWKKLGRQVKKGEKAIKILAPLTKKYEKEKLVDGEMVTEEVTEVYGFKLVNVFDISQTEGEELPELCLELMGNSKQAKSLIKALEKIIDIPIKEEEMGYNGYFLPKPIEKRMIGLRKGMSLNQKAKTLTHEYAHYFLALKKDKGVLNLKEFTEGTEDYEGLYAVEEVIVESIAFVVSQYFGLDTSEYSFEYVTSWAKGDINNIKKVGGLIQRYSQEIIDKLENKMDFDKEKVA